MNVKTSMNIWKQKKIYLVKKNTIIFKILPNRKKSNEIIVTYYFNMLGSNFEFLFARTFLGYYLKSHFFFFFFHVLQVTSTLPLDTLQKYKEIRNLTRYLDKLDTKPHQTLSYSILNLQLWVRAGDALSFIYIQSKV